MKFDHCPLSSLNLQLACITISSVMIGICSFGQTLYDFQYIDSSGRDQGSNVRRKSQGLIALVNDKERMREVRLKAEANEDRWVPSEFVNASVRLHTCMCLLFLCIIFLSFISVLLIFFFSFFLF